MKTTTALIVALTLSCLHINSYAANTKNHQVKYYGKDFLLNATSEQPHGNTYLELAVGIVDTTNKLQIQMTQYTKESVVCSKRDTRLQSTFLTRLPIRR